MHRILDNRFATLLVALVLALGAALAVAMYVSRYKESVSEGNSLVNVVIAKKDIPQGLSGDDAVAKGYVELDKVQQDSLAPTGVQTVDSLKGRVASSPIYAGAQVLNEQFPQKPNNIVALDVAGKERAVQVPLDQTRGLVGTLKAKDKVDIMTTFNFQPRDRSGKNQGEAYSITLTLLRNIEVLTAPAGDPNAKGGGMAAAGGKGNAFAMVALTDKQAEKLVFAMENGKVWLALRGAHATDSPQPAGVKVSVTTLTSEILGTDTGRLIPQDRSNSASATTPGQ
jgi:Flp pilus assembly protein CpaB